jgi:hypothetical protein
MTTKIIRGDGVTELAGVKSCTFTEKVNAEPNLRPGCVSAAQIDVEVFGPQSGAVAVGEELTYYQVDAEGNETLIGVFYARPSVPSKTTYKFTAYDAAANLDVDFSERLYSIASDFPMTVYDLVSEACSVAGVTLGSASWPLSTLTVNEFYSPAITCREILSWAAEIACCFVKCDTAGELVFDWYSADSTHKIYPSSGASGGVTFVPYRENGLDYENYDVAAIQYVAVSPIDTEGVAYVYPYNYQDITANDPLGDGDVTLADLVAVDDGDGNIAISTNINITDDGNGNLVIQNSGEVTGGNTLVIADNLLLCDATQATMTSVAQNVYNRMTALGTYRPASVELFNFDNPFRAGDIVAVEDIQGVNFNTLVMEMTTGNSGAAISSTGEREQSDAPQTTAGRLARLGENLVRLNKLKVSWADIEEAIIQYLKLYGFMDVYEDATLTTKGGQIGFVRGEYSLGEGISIQSLKRIGSLNKYYGSVLGIGQMSAFIASGNYVNPIDSSDFDLEDFGTVIELDGTGIKFSTKALAPDSLLPVYNAEFMHIHNDHPDYSFDPDAPYNWFSGYSAFDHITIQGNVAVAHQTKTVTGTTNSAGNIGLGLTEDYGVIYVRSTDANAICNPWWDLTSQRWITRVTNTDGTVLANTSVTLEVAYYSTSELIPSTMR